MTDWNNTLTNWNRCFTKDLFGKTAVIHMVDGDWWWTWNEAVSSRMPTPEAAEQDLMQYITEYRKAKG